jgi:hypothetical protein
VVERSGSASDAGTGACFGVAGCVVSADGFGAARRFGAAVVFGAVGRLRAAVAFGAPTGAIPELERRGAMRDGGDFDALARNSSGFDGLRVGVGRGALRVRACCAACAALAFFFACLAALLLAFANFRARLSTFLAARTCCFAASARAAAAVASAFSRCVATALFVSVDWEVATVRCLAK